MTTLNLNVRRTKDGITVRVPNAEGRTTHTGMPIWDEVKLDERGNGEIRGYGADGARAIRNAAAIYLDTWQALSPEERGRLLLHEADTYRDWCEDKITGTIAAAAARVAAHGDDGDDASWDVETAIDRARAASKARNRLYESLSLIWGSYLYNRWGRHGGALWPVTSPANEGDE